MRPEATLAGRSPTEGELTTADFVECYRMHYPRLLRALCLAGATPAAAEDVAQEAFARSLVHWRRVRQGTNPPGYVYRSAFRLYARRVPDGDGTPAPEPVDRRAGDTQAEAVARVGMAAALAAMPPRRRRCATLCFVVGMPTATVAEVLGIAEGTVRKQLELARAALRGAMADGSEGRFPPG